MFLTDHPNARQNHDMNIANSSSENVALFMYLGMTVKDENLIQEEIKRILSAGNTCCNSVHNLFSFHLLSENIKYKKLLFCIWFCMGAKLVSDIIGGVWAGDVENIWTKER
jgi:hypothetical protein